MTLAAAIRLQLAVLLMTTVAAAQIPAKAKPYKATLRAEIRRQWGVNPPVDANAILAGTIHQESAWNPRAESPLAQGITQFTPSTWSWITGLDPTIAQLGDVWNPNAAIRAAAYYHRYLWRRIEARTEQDIWCGVLSSYNGGEGWYRRDRRIAQSEEWFGKIEHVNAGRSAANFAENRNYVARIWWRWRPLYQDF